jgi:hypothetical protein
MAQDTEMRLVNGIPRSYTTADNVESFTNDASAVAVGDAVYISAAGKVSKASNATAAQECFGLVFEVTDSTNCRVITRGILDDVLTGATANTRYYLGATAGTLVTSKPSGTAVIQVVGIAYNATDLIVCPQVGVTENPLAAASLDDVYSNSGSSPTITIDDGPITLAGAASVYGLQIEDDVRIGVGSGPIGYIQESGGYVQIIASGVGAQGIYMNTASGQYLWQQVRDNRTNAFLLRTGSSDHYIEINTTTGAEEIVFGNPGAPHYEDLLWYAGASTDYVLFDQSAAEVFFEDTTLHIGDYTASQTQAALVLGDDSDVALLWDNDNSLASFSAGTSGARAPTYMSTYISIRDAANLLDLSAALEQAALSINAEAGHATDTIFGIYAQIDNTAGTPRTGTSEAACVAAAPEGFNNVSETGGYYYAFQARDAVPNAGSGTFFGLQIGSNYDIGIEVDSGGVQVDGGGVTINAAKSGSMGLEMDALDIGASANYIGDIYCGDIYQNSYIRQTEMADPGAAAANTGYIYVKDVSGNTQLFFRNSATGAQQITGTAASNPSLDDVYNNSAGSSYTIAVDAGPIVLNTSTTSGGALDINPSLTTETAAQIDISWAAGAYTGQPHGLWIDYSGMTSLTNSSDVIGVYLEGEGMSGGGIHTGIYLASGWDVGMSSQDGIITGYGSSNDAYLSWDTTTYSVPALDVLRWNLGGTRYMTLDGYFALIGESGGDFHPVTAPASSSCMFVGHAAGDGTSDFIGFQSHIQNNNGTARAAGAGLYYGVASKITGNVSDHADGVYTAFKAMDSTDSSGAATLVGLEVGSGFDVGIRVESGGLVLNDNQKIQLGSGSGDLEIWSNGSVIQAVPVAAAESIYWGDSAGTNQLDHFWFGTSISNYLLWDASGNKIQTLGVDIKIQDGDFLDFGNANDVFMYWDNATAELRTYMQSGSYDYVTKLGTNTSTSQWRIENFSGTDIIEVLGSGVVEIQDNTLLAFGGSTDVRMEWETGFTPDALRFMASSSSADEMYTNFHVIHSNITTTGTSPGPKPIPTGEEFYYLWGALATSGTTGSLFRSHLDQNTAPAPARNAAGPMACYKSDMTTNASDVANTSYYGFWANTPTDNGGLQTLIGIYVDSGFDKGITLEDDTTLEFGRTFDVTMAWNNASSRLDVMPAVDETPIYWGDGTNSLEQRWYAGHSTAYMDWTITGGLGQLTFAGATQILMTDDSPVYLGNSIDSWIVWEGTNNTLRILNNNASGQTVIQLGSDTATSDFIVERDSGADILRIDGEGDMVWTTASTAIVWDRSANRQIMYDNAELVLGTSLDATIKFDSADDRVEVLSLSNPDEWHWGYNDGTSNPGGTTNKWNVVWWAAPTIVGASAASTAFMAWDSTNRSLTLDDSYLSIGARKPNNSAGLYFGGGTSYTEIYGGTSTFVITGQSIGIDATVAGFDTWEFQGSSGINTVTLIAASDLLDIDGIDVRLQDDDQLIFGNSNDIVMRWDTAGTDHMRVLPAVDGYDWYWGNGTLSLDMIWYGSSTSSFMTWASASNYLNFDGADIWMEDDDQIRFGDLGSSDSYIQWTGSTSVWLFNNNNTGGETLFQLGSNTTATEFRIENNSGNDLLQVTGNALPGWVSVTRTVASTGQTGLFSAFNTTTYGGTIVANVSTGIGWSVNGRFTVPSDGAYQIDVSMFIEQSAIAALDTFSLRKNGTTTIWTTNSAFIHSSVDPVERSIQGIFTLAASDYIEVMVDSNGANTATVHAGSTFNMRRILGS